MLSCGRFSGSNRTIWMLGTTFLMLTCGMMNLSRTAITCGFAGLYYREVDCMRICHSLFYYCAVERIQIKQSWLFDWQNKDVLRYLDDGLECRL